MRARKFAALSAITLAMSVLVGCTATLDSPSPLEPTVPAELEPAPPVDLCAAAAPSGASSAAVAVEGAFGSPASAVFATPLAVLSPERTVVVQGDGEAIDSASLVDFATTVFDAGTGEQLQTQGYNGAPTLPVPAVGVGQLLGCATVGSRLTVALPETDQGGATVWVLDVLRSTPARSTGADNDPVDGMPAVEIAENGAPVVTVPRVDPPADTRVAALKEGDGATVASGDSVMVHYTVVRWSDGTVFDSSWAKGTPTAVVTTEVIAGYREALEGRTVGSQVLAVIPPGSAYGEGQINEDDLVGETLVFVIDILAAVPPA